MLPRTKSVGNLCRSKCRPLPRFNPTRAAKGRKDDGAGMYVGFSPDGLRWAAHGKGPVLPTWPEGHAKVTRHGVDGVGFHPQPVAVRVYAVAHKKNVGRVRSTGVLRVHARATDAAVPARVGHDASGCSVIMERPALTGVSHARSRSPVSVQTQQSWQAAIRQKPGPEVDVEDLTPAIPPPTAIVIAAISSSDCTTTREPLLLWSVFISSSCGSCNDMEATVLASATE